MKRKLFNRKITTLIIITVMCSAAVFIYANLRHHIIISATQVSSSQSDQARAVPDTVVDELAQYPVNVAHEHNFLPEKTLNQAIERSGSYLIKHCSPEGRYLYRANLNRQVNVYPKYNMLRHAGAIYALTAYLKQNPSEPGKQTLLRSVDFMKEKTIQTVENRDNMLAVMSIPEITNNGKKHITAKLGGTGLGLVALCATNEVFPATTPLHYLEQLANFIVFMQDKDGGFTSKYYPETGVKDEKWTSLYYPGEAALGLVMLYEQDKNTKWLQAAADAIACLALKRKDQDSVEADHWVLLATARLLPHYDQCKPPISREAYMHHVEQIVLSIVDGGCHFNPKDLEYGAFNSDARTCPTAIRLEGLLAAYTVIPEKKARIRKMILSRINTGIGFLVKSQVFNGPFAGGIPRAVKPLTMRHPNASEQFNKRITEIRIDYVQHALSAMLQYRHMFYTASKPNPERSEEPDVYLFTKQEVSLDSYPKWIRQFVQNLPWQYASSDKKGLSPEILNASLRLGSQFLQNNQTQDGNFNYMYNFITKKVEQGDSQVRQAGALWGLVLIYQHHPKPLVRKAIMKSLEFFLKHAEPGPVEDSLLINYPGFRTCKTGTVALVTLSLIDLLRTEEKLEKPLPPEELGKLRKHLQGFLNFLKYMLRADNHFAAEYSLERKEKAAFHSPYFDGEALLAFIKAAKYLNHKDLISIIEDISLPLAKCYTIDQWHEFYDSDMTKGFSQWGCMAFTEYSHTEWREAGTFRDCTIALSWWLVFVHQVLDRNRNTAYAFEGLLHGYSLMENKKSKEATALREAIDDGLYKLTSWQVGGPLVEENDFLRRSKTLDLHAVGGVMNGSQDPFLRIDVTQHQMHAVILCLKYLFQK